MFFQTAVLAALAAGASAHLRLHSPAPFEWENSATSQSPLEPADFPCKQPAGTYAATTMNTVAAGGSLEVQIIGGATHGGGSCQFSITTDPKPNKDSQWKVLHSQIHGCVGGPANDNMSGDKDDLNNPKIPVKIPEGLPAGQYTFAWSWFNKLGNREFYMNCAPLEVTGGSGDVSEVLGGLPDMFVANLPNTECEVAAGQDFVYPDPGPSVAQGEGAVPGTAMSGSGCATQNKLGAGAGKLGSPSTPTTDKPAESAAPSASSAPAATPTPAGGSTGGASDPTTGGSTGGSTGSSSCTQDGALICISSTQFGICNGGQAVPQNVAPGTTCSNGAIVRRSIKFPRGNVHARHASLH